MGKILSKWINKALGPLLRKIGKKVLGGAKYLAAKVYVLVLGILGGVARWLESHSLNVFDLEAVGRIAARGLIQGFLKTPEARQASELMSDAIALAFQGYSLAVLAVALICAALLLLTALPLVQRAARKHRARIFVSFQHLLEPVAVNVEKALAQSGFRTLRLPYVPGASHQQVVMESNRLMRSSHAVVCLPGRDPSFVEAEIGGATHGLKPVAFLLPREGGSLPNSADKRYPVFRLEETEEKRFEPLATFLHYVVADLASGWQQVKNAVRHPFVSITGYGSFGLLLTILLVLFGLAYAKALSATAALAAQGGAFAEVRNITVLANVGVVVALAALVLGVAGYTLLVIAGVWRQWRAQRRAALKAGLADFARDDWRAVIPGLVPGSDLYECLFESAPAAHHEEARA